MKTVSITRASLLLMTATLAACASKPPPREGGRGAATQQSRDMVIARPYAVLFTSFDADRDRLISRDELDAGITAEWAMASDGSNAALSRIALDRWKTSAFGHEDVVPGTRQFDRNANYAVTKEEFSNALVGSFVQMDRNKDGALSRDELVRAMTMGRGNQRGEGGSGQGRGGRGGGGGERGQRPR